MSKTIDQLQTENPMHFDRDSSGFRYFANAVDRHWNPHEIDLSDDPDQIMKMVDDLGVNAFERIRGELRGISPAEEAVMDDLAPFAVALDDPDDQAYITTQLYEEAKHTLFFDRYWREVIQPVEDELGLERSYPKNWEGTDQASREDNWSEFFLRVEEAVENLLEDDSPEAKAYALCHYHLVGEGIGAQVAYFNAHSLYESDAVPELPNLPGYLGGLQRIRQDEGRHVGWGMSKLKEFVANDEVSPEYIQETVDDFMPFLMNFFEEEEYPDLPGLPEDAIADYAMEKHEQRMQQIVDASEDIPSLNELTTVETYGD
jgi:ribonucleoside-diphosphate reductase beta chain